MFCVFLLYSTSLHLFSFFFLFLGGTEKCTRINRGGRDRKEKEGKEESEKEGV